MLVLADKGERIERVKQRDHSSEAEIRRRIKNQRNFEKETDHVDYVIYNNGTLEELKKKAEIVYQDLLPERDS